MTQKPHSKRSDGKTPHGKPGSKPSSDEMNQATTEEFEREDLGIAPKE